jgi:hypothetical protein
MPETTDITTLFTLTDIEVGLKLYDALVQHATSTQGAPIGHADLLTLGRQLYPKDAMLGRAVPVGIGAKLLFIDAFCTANAYPPLACLAVSEVRMQPKAGYEGDWEADAQAVAGFNWSTASVPLAAFAAQMRTKLPKRFKPRQERPADVAWYAYFCSHRAQCATLGAEDKTEIINLLMAGLDPETALRRVMAAKAEMSGPVQNG